MNSYKKLYLLMLAALASNGASAASGIQAITFSGGSTFSKTATAKVNQGLLALSKEYKAYQKQASTLGAAAPAFKSSNTLARVANELVVIDTAATGNPKTLAADLRALGARKITVFGRTVSARLPLSAISALSSLPSLRLARPSYAIRNAGSVTSQGDASMRADIARAATGLSGAGVTVGTLSDSYNCLGGAPAGVTSGDLPAGVTLLAEQSPCTGATDEGRAMMEIIHDVAPGAAQAFHSAFNGQADFAQGIIDLATPNPSISYPGAKIINDDVFYFAEPFYQDGNVAQAVNTVKGMGVAYFSSAGNQARRAYESAFNPSGAFLNIGFGNEELHDFDPGPGVDTCQQLTIPTGRTITLDFQWDQPFFSASGAPGSASDMDIILTDGACSSAIAFSIDNNLGGDPFEAFQYTNPGSTNIFGVIILHRSGPNPGLMKYVNLGSSSITIDQFDTKTGASWGHSAALGGLGVGAAFYRQTPAFGIDPPVIESFSSAGSTPILFDAAGARLATPEIRQQPDITAPDGGNTTFFFAGTDPEPDGFPNFFGTSAAAPHAAGVAALLKEQKPAITPDNIYSALKTTTIDMDDPFTIGFDFGYDDGSGFGLIQADSAYSAVVCDVTNDGVVSKKDIADISSRLRTTVAAGTLGDITRDGQITTQDARACVLQCTSANCADPT